MDVYLHVGTAKTGTSAIQNRLGDSREALARHGILYPELPGHGRHGRLGMFIRPDVELMKLPIWIRGKGRELTPEQFRNWFREKSLAEVETKSPTSVIYSDEALFTVSDAALHNLGEFVRLFADRVHVVAYLRRQDDHLNSRYQQTVRTGATSTLAELVQTDRSRLYDYASRLQHLQKVLEPTSVLVRPFERGGFPEGDLVLDFLQTVGAEAVHAELSAHRQQPNESMSAEAVEVLRLLNVMRVSDEGLLRRELDNREHVATLSRSLRGPALAAPEHLLDTLMHKWGPSNASVAREFLGRDDGILFREPRKSNGVTRTQRIEPDRMDEILNLLAWDSDVRERFRSTMATDYATG